MLKLAQIGRPYLLYAARVWLGAMVECTACRGATEWRVQLSVCVLQRFDS